MIASPQDSGTPAEIACPRCRAPIRTRDGELVCTQHGAVGRRGTDATFLFADDDAYWGEIDRDRMRRVNADARLRGWSAAVQQHLAGTDLLPYVQHPARADWRVLFPLDRERTVSLDVGAGWGAISFGLAPHVRRHYALERVPERLEFIAIRKLQDGVENVVPLCADLHAVPLLPASLDLVAVNGVLEWAGLVDPERAPHRAPREPGVLQEAFLRQLCLLLRPGGRLYVGIENRYGRLFWRGTPDHQGLRYTSLMPRALARAYSRWRAARSPRTFVTESDYRTWTYSLRGTRQLLERCGFQDVEAYAVVPGYNAPMQIVPLADPGAFLYLATRLQTSGLASLRRAVRVATCALHLEAQVTSCFAFTARVPDLGAR